MDRGEGGGTQGVCIAVDVLPCCRRRRRQRQRRRRRDVVVVGGDNAKEPKVDGEKKS